MKKFSFSKSSLDNMAGVDPMLQDIAHRALEITAVDFGIPDGGGLRTAEEQHDMYYAGASPLDGYKKKSYHQTGRAIDVFAYVDGKASWEPEHLAMVACAMLQAAAERRVRLEWGGLWKRRKKADGSWTFGPDMPHFQAP